MPERVWFRSLYWRVAFGFVAFLAIMLLAQGGFLFWLVARNSDEVAGRNPHDVATLVAADLSAAMAAGTVTDLAAYLREHYGGLSRPVVLVMADGTIHTSHVGPELPPPLIEMAMRRLSGEAWRPFGPPRPGYPGWQSDAGSSPPGAVGPRSRDGGSLQDAGRTRPVEPDPQPTDGGPQPGGSRFFGGSRPAIGLASVVKDNAIVAVVVVPPTEPLPILLRQFAPAASAIAVGLLVVATTLAALFVFRPAQQRLRALEDAARRLGAGDATARAPVAGGDEVTSVARAFNTMADELDRRASALEAAIETRRQLLADVSHELATPLTAIRGYLETLEMVELNLDDEARRRYLGIVGAETERLEHIIGDLLDLARLEAGGGTFAPKPVDIAWLFGRVIERHERAARVKRVRMTATVEPHADIIVADAGRLEQVLQNLAANALRHTPADGEVELRSGLRDDGIVLSVRDTGEGIDAEHLDHVFDRFYKADVARGADGRGSGLGLSIAKAIVERHGGTIAVRSDPGRETVFEVWLPRAGGLQASDYRLQA